MSHTVYKFSCLHDATKFYIGKTHRHLSVRAREHTRLATGNTAISDHIRSCETCQSRPLNFHDFSILSKCNTKFECNIKEALFIKNFQPKLNKQLHNSGSSFILKIF